MRIFCSRTELNRALSNVSHSIPVRTTSAILEGILFEVWDDGTMTLTSTDTTITIETTIKAEADYAGAFVVPAKLITSIIAKLPDDDVSIEYSEEKNKINIRCAGSTSELICFSADEFPKIKLEEGQNQVILNKEDVKKLIRKTAFSASADEFNGVLTGVLLEIKDRVMKMVAVDPFRIATYSVNVDNDYDMNVIIPAKLAQDVAKIISDEGEDKMSIEIVNNKVVMNFDNNKAVINTFSGKYIDYKRILSKEGEINIRVKRQDLLKSIDRASLLSSAQNNNLIKFNIEGDTINITSLSEEGSIDEKVEIIKEGDDIVIGMNSKYLKDALSVIDDEEVLINMRDQVSPCIIKPLKGDKYVYLVLPIRIN